jgi:hypothetical protein
MLLYKGLSALRDYKKRAVDYSRFVAAGKTPILMP